MMATKSAAETLFDYKRMIGENIRKIRRSKGWSVDKLRAEMINFGVTFASSTVVCWENGSRGVQTHILPVIAAALGCPVDKILPSSSGRNMPKAQKGARHGRRRFSMD